MKGLRLVCSFWIVLILVVLAIIILFGSADASDQGDIIDGMQCFCVAENIDHNDCPGVWGWYLCFPNYPDYVPMVYRFTCDGTIADPPDPTPTLQPTLYPPFMLRWSFLPIIYRQRLGPLPTPAPTMDPFPTPTITPAPTMQP